MSERKLRLGVVGLGRAFTLMRPAFIASPLIEIVAATDPRPEARQRFVEEFHGAGYSSLAEMLRDPAIEAIYIASPHQYHAAQTIEAAAAGKHVLIEKPMAIGLDEAQAMLEATRKAQVKLIVGHSHSFDSPIAETRKIIASGVFGSLKMITALNFTDFLYRPRRPEELDTSAGGGVVFNQAMHQIDIVRLLAGGLAESVVAQTGIWDASRATEGAYTAMIRFAGDVAATITYSGYAHFDSDEFLDWTSEMGTPKDPDSVLRTRRSLPRETSRAQEQELRRQRGYGVAKSDATLLPGARWHEHFGLIIASCERADLRPTPQGIVVHSDSDRQLRQLERPPIPRHEVIEELCAAVLDGVEPTHSGEWGFATLEACLALLRSSREKREITLHNQVPVVAPA
jgi:phthalate 4,5-cis-dihydrodiol dehydrogenase